MKRITPTQAERIEQLTLKVLLRIEAVKAWLRGLFGMGAK